MLNKHVPSALLVASKSTIHSTDLVIGSPGTKYRENLIYVHLLG